MYTKYRHQKTWCIWLNEADTLCQDECRWFRLSAYLIVDIVLMTKGNSKNMKRKGKKIIFTQTCSNISDFWMHCFNIKKNIEEFYKRHIKVEQSSRDQKHELAQDTIKPCFKTSWSFAWAGETVTVKQACAWHLVKLCCKVWLLVISQNCNWQNSNPYQWEGTSALSKKIHDQTLMSIHGCSECALFFFSFFSLKLGTKFWELMLLRINDIT